MWNYLDELNGPIYIQIQMVFLSLTFDRWPPSKSKPYLSENNFGYCIFAKYLYMLISIPLHISSPITIMNVKYNDQYLLFLLFIFLSQTNQFMSNQLILNLKAKCLRPIDVYNTIIRIFINNQTTTTKNQQNKIYIY